MPLMCMLMEQLGRWYYKQTFHIMWRYQLLMFTNWISSYWTSPQVSNTCFTTLKCPALGPINYCWGRVCGLQGVHFLWLEYSRIIINQVAKHVFFALLQDTDKEAWTEMFENPPELLTEVCHRTICHIYIGTHWFWFLKSQWLENMM